MENIVKENQAWIDGIWEKIDKKLKPVSLSAYDKLPYTTVNGKYTNKDIVHIDLTSVSEHASLINGFLQNAIRSSATIKHHITGSHTMTAI